MSQPDPDLVLYELTSCPYCAKVRRALSDLDLQYSPARSPAPDAGVRRCKR